MDRTPAKHRRWLAKILSPPSSTIGDYPQRIQPSQKTFMMNRRSIILAVVLTMPISSIAQVWATAVSRNESAGTVIVYRYIKEFRKDFARDKQPVRIIVVWRYQGEKGMPSPEERVRMDELEDALAPLQAREFSTLALVSTGNNLKEWTYYAQKEDEFFRRLNLALYSKTPFPIEIHAAPDPSWTTYESFAAGVKQ